MNNKVTGGKDKEILYSKTVKAGKRIYYIDVKKNLRNDLFVAITESKKVQSSDGLSTSFEKHKIFIYKEDFDKFKDSLLDVFDFVEEKNKKEQIDEEGAEELTAGLSDEIKLNIEY